MTARARWRWTLAGALAATLTAGCQCAAPAPGAVFRCDEGDGCPAGYLCAGDGYCDPDGTGGGAGGGSGGGSGGGTAVDPCAGAWCWDHPRPWGAVPLRSVAVRAADDVWIAGENGALFHWDGARWQQFGALVRADLADVWASPQGEVWAVGSFGTVLHVEGGALALRGPVGVNDSYQAIDGVSSDDFWVVGGNSRISRYQSGSWSDLFSQPTGVTYYAVAAKDPARTFVVGDQVQYWNQTMLAAVPRPLPLTLRSVWVGPAGDAWVAGSGGALFRTSTVPDAGWSDAGTGGWERLDSGTLGGLTSVWGTTGDNVFYAGTQGIYLDAPGFAGPVSTLTNVSALHGTGPAEVWAVTGDGTVSRRSTLGGAFTDMRQQVARTSVGLRSIAVHDDGSAFIGGEAHLMLRRSAQGDYSTVPVETTPTWGTFWEIWSDQPDRAWAVGDDPVRLAYYDPGTGSFKRPAGFTVLYNLWCVWGSGPADVWAGGENGYLIHFDGTSWSDKSSLLPTAFTIEGIWGTGPNDVFFVGSSPTIVHYDGQAFTSESTPGTGALWAVQGASSSEVWASGPGGVVLRRVSADAGWVSEPSGVTSAVNNLAVADGEVMAVTDDGRIVRRMPDAGWRQMGSATRRSGFYFEAIAGRPGVGLFAVGSEGSVVHFKH